MKHQYDVIIVGAPLWKTWNLFSFIQPESMSFDSRDTITDERLAKINTEDGVWGCKTMWACSEVCPKDIPITQCLGQIKRAIKKR